VRSAFTCFLYLEMAAHLQQGSDPRAAYAQLCVQAPVQLAEVNIAEKEIARFTRILNGTLGSLPEALISSSGYVVHTLEASLWCLLNYDDFSSAVLAAVNLGDDTDTTGAVVGGLAGLWYGAKNIPVEWLDVLARRADIEQLVHRIAPACALSLPH
jgi:ADP-ribosyl-[dinitrogen reductase] hydrolase